MNTKQKIRQTKSFEFKIIPYNEAYIFHRYNMTDINSLI